MRLLIRAAPTQRPFDRDTLLHQILFCMQKLFAQRPRCTQKLLPRDPFTHEGFYTETLSNRSSCTETLLDTVEFAQSSLYTETILHTETFTQSSLYTESSLYTAHFAREGCTGQTFYRCFWRCTRISCRRVAHTSFYYFSSEDEHARSPQTVGRAPATTCILPQFLAINTRFGRDGCVSEASVSPAPAALR